MNAKSTGSAPLGFGTAKKVALFFDISVEKVRRMAATGAWPTYCVGGRRLFDLDELVRLVKQPTANDKRNGD